MIVDWPLVWIDLGVLALLASSPFWRAAQARRAQIRAAAATHQLRVVAGGGLLSSMARLQSFDLKLQVEYRFPPGQTATTTCAASGADPGVTVESATRKRAVDMFLGPRGTGDARFDAVVSIPDDRRDRAMLDADTRGRLLRLIESGGEVRDGTVSTGVHRFLSAVEVAARLEVVSVLAARLAPLSDGEVEVRLAELARRDPDVGVRRCAMRELVRARASEPGVLSARTAVIRELLSEAEASIRLQAAVLLQDRSVVRQAPLQDLIRLAPECPTELCAVVARAGLESVLIELLAGPPDVCGAAAARLQEMGTVSAVPALRAKTTRKARRRCPLPTAAWWCPPRSARSRPSRRGSPGPGSSAARSGCPSATSGRSTSRRTSARWAWRGPRGASEPSPRWRRVQPPNRPESAMGSACWVHDAGVSGEYSRSTRVTPAAVTASTRLSV